MLRWMNLSPHMTAKIRPPGKSSPVPGVHPALTWLHTVHPPNPPNVRHAEKTTSPSCGTTCPGVYTATTFAMKTRKWRESARPQTTGSVGVKRASILPMISAWDTQSARPDWVLKPEVWNNSFCFCLVFFFIWFTVSFHLQFFLSRRTTSCWHGTSLAISCYNFDRLQ